MARPRPVTSALVVGAGLAGLCLARELARRDFAVTLLEDPTSPCATRVASGLLQVAGGRISRLHLGLRQACRDYYPDFLAGLGLQLRCEGHLRLGEESTSLASFASTLRGLGLPATALGAEQVQESEPCLKPLPGGAVRLDASTIDAELLLQSLTRALEGRVVRKTARVMAREGRKLTDSRGGLWAADVLVLACGAGLVGLHELPYRELPGWGARFEGTLALRHSLEWPAVGETLVPLAGGWRVGGLPERGPSALMDLLSAKGVEKDRQFAVRLAAPDGLPVVGCLEKGVYVLGGLARNGLLTAPLLAAGLAEQIAGSAPDWLRPFAPDRSDIKRRRSWSP